MSDKRETINKSDRDGLKRAAHEVWALAALTLLAVAPSALANHVQVTNVELLSGGLIQFDISWENSWRESWLPVVEAADTVESWDAAWVFVKFRRAGQQTIYSHATLSTAVSDHSVPDGVALDVGVTTGREPGEGVGVFLYRDTTGNPGSNNWTGIKLKWENVKDGVASGEVEMQIHAIEMVYVPEGAFKAGTGVDESGSFKNGTSADAFLVDATWSGPVDSTPNARRIGEVDGQLWGFSTSGNNSIGPAGTLNNNYPTGYSAFYCMKYDITQGQYAAFLTASQYNGWADKTSERYSITRDGTAGSYVYTAGKPYVACNFLTWENAASYKAWAGLRPMTELEFEKACRGPLEPVEGEYAWGTAAGTPATGIAYDGEANERASNSVANVTWDNQGTGGPLRVGAFATDGSGRAEAGASYWGIMELSGNVFLRAVGVASRSTGNETKPRDFQGTHGSGSTTLPADWPQNDGIGVGFRGGGWRSSSDVSRVSCRTYAAIVATAGDHSRGGRGVRSAP